MYICKELKLNILLNLWVLVPCLTGCIFWSPQYVSASDDLKISTFQYDALGRITYKHVLASSDTDSDNDGIADVIEITTGTNPNFNDTDGDKIADGIEDTNRNGQCDDGEGDPRVANTNMTDSDHDSLIDYLENLTCTDPLLADSDGDGLTDGTEDSNHNGVIDPGESDPCFKDTADSDGDGLLDVIDICIGKNALGDMDHDGICDGNDPTLPDLLGIIRGADLWYLDRNSSGLYETGNDSTGFFGFTGVQPFAFDLNGDGLDEIGVFSGGQWYIDQNHNGVWDEVPVDLLITNFGGENDLPVVGDWNGDGLAEIGIYRPASNTWYLDYDRSFTFNQAVDTTGTFGIAGCLPVVGDWNGNGRDKIGVYFEGQWYLDFNGNFGWDSGLDTFVPSFGVAGMIPVAGDWNGDGVDKIGVFRDGEWFLDINGNGIWESGNDRQISAFGQPNDIPVVGRWHLYSPDYDNDGIRDYVEDTNLNGVVDRGETDPHLADTDGDGISDGADVCIGNNAYGDINFDGICDDDGILYRFAAGANHSVLLKTDGTLRTWGLNTYGQLGDKKTGDRIYWAKIGAGSTWASIASGDNHSVALKSDGTLWAWGHNDSGQLGNGTWIDKNTPTQIGTDNNWASVFAAASHSVAIKSDGTLWAWGSGTGPIPAQVGTDNRWFSVALGSDHTVALKSDGTLWAWGTNYIGELGDGTTVPRSAPVRIAEGSIWVSVTAGGLHTAAVKSDGTLWTWGLNEFGELGDGDTTLHIKNIPSQVGSENSWVSVGAGVYHTAAVKSDGTLWAWGYNNYGQLGDGTTVNKSVPVKIGTNTTWVSVAGKYYQTSAMRSDGTLWAWGYNDSGQLGDGTTTNRSTPKRVTGGGRLLVVTKAGTGSGSVVSTPSGIDCGADCKDGFPLDSQVTLTAVPEVNTSTEFTGWSGGACTGSSPSCTVTMNANQSVTATFTHVGDTYGQWEYHEDDGLGVDDTCDSDLNEDYTCLSGTAKSCIDVSDFQGDDWYERHVTCVP